MDVRFDEVRRERPVGLVSPQFVQHRDTFGGQKGVPYERLAPAPEHRLGETDRRYGAFSVSSDEPAFTVFRSPEHPRVPFASVVVDVHAFASHGREQDTVFAGLVKDERNYLMAWFSGVAGTVGIDVVVDGEVRNLVARQSHFLAPCRLAFSLTGDWVGAFVEQEDGFRPITTCRLPDGLDLRLPGTLAEYRYGFGVRSTTGTVVLHGVEAGHFGQLGLRDPRLVTNADGSPYTRFGQYFLTATHAGLEFFDTAHWGVWRLDPTDLRLENVAKLFFRRGGSDSVLGDHSGHLVRDEADNRWIAATSTWGDFTGDHVEVGLATVPLRTNLLEGLHVLDSEPLPLPVDKLPTAAAGQWDPHVVRVGDRWHVAFVNAREFFDFYPALAAGEPGGPLTELTLVGADAEQSETSGVTLTRFGGRWYLLAGQGAGAPEAPSAGFPVYDLSMRAMGTLDAPHPTSIPWPTLVPLPGRRHQSRWVLLTSDATVYDREAMGYGSHGDLVVMEGDAPTRQEYPG
jgi:hypothetical protein